MSIIGPRPLLYEYLPYLQRLKGLGIVRPGLSEAWRRLVAEII